MNMPNDLPTAHADSLGFPDTPWSQVLKAKRGQGEEAFDALDKLCIRYRPVIRRVFLLLVRNPNEADDMTQTFFINRFVRTEFLGSVEAENGCFRHFLRHCIGNHARSYLRDRQRRPDSGDLAIPWESGHETLSGASPSPEDLADAELARQILEEAKERLLAEASQSGQRELADAVIAQFEGSESPGLLAEFARRSGKSESAVHVAAFRIRERWRWLIQDEVRALVANPTALKDELRHLAEALARCPAPTG